LWVAQMPLAMLAFGGVFQAHPDLKVVLNEQRGFWVEQKLRDLDSIHVSPWNRLLREAVPEPPSYYWRKNCFLGASFIARFEVEDRYAMGLETITWARDYPHVEGTWPWTKEALRHAFSGLPSEEVAAMLGLNALRAYPVDGPRLRAIADRIGPTVDEVAAPLEAAPEGSYSFAFRDMESAPGGARFGGY
jgi:predicted TIM-barrel fold metal-dependent hydrolase